MNGSTLLPSRAAAWQAGCMRIRHLNHSTYQLQYHLVWGTKYRRKFLKPYVKAQLLECLYDLVKKYPTLHIESINTDEDHVHMQIEIPPNITVADVVQKLKTKSSLELKKHFKFIREMYLENNIWSVGYFVSSIGLNEEQVKKYIAWQTKKDLSQTSKLFN